MLVSEILSKHDIHISLTENLFNLEFEGTFDNYMIEENEKWGNIYRCFDNHYAIEILPSQNMTLWYLQHDDIKKNGSASLYNSNGTLVTNTMVLPRKY